MASKRMTANPLKAPRYRAGKAVTEVSSSDSEASEEETVPTPIPRKPASASSAVITKNLGKVDLHERRQISATEEAARIEAEKARRLEEEEGFVTESEEASNDETTEESEEEESEEEQPRRILMRPTFIKKEKRNGHTASQARAEGLKQAEEEARKKQAADDIVEEQIRRDLAAKAAGKKHWDDDEDSADDVDDTDDLDPEAEYAAWKLRELRRIKRDREAIEAKELELEEIERRKNLTEEERKAEDDAFIEKQNEERAGKGKMSYLQKYYHKGAFFQDTEDAQELSRRDIMGARYADDVQNRELLPQALQMRDMTKLGKKGATKYRDLKSEDTGRFGRFDDRRSRRGGPLTSLPDERFLSDLDRERSNMGQDRTGPNNMPVGERKRSTTAPGVPREGRSPNPQDGRIGGDYRHHNSFSGSRSRSRSLGDSDRAEKSCKYDSREDDRYRRKRSYSRDGVSEKRRRLED